MKSRVIPIYLLFFPLLLFSCLGHKQVAETPPQIQPASTIKDQPTKKSTGTFQLFDEKFYAISLDDKINVRKEPNLNSEILGQAQSGEIFEFVEKIGESETINGMEGKWYKIKYTPQSEGFVFGPFFLVFQNIKRSHIPLYTLRNLDHSKQKSDKEVTVGLSVESSLKNGEFELEINLIPGDPLDAKYKPGNPPLLFLGRQDGPGISSESSLHYDLRKGKFLYSSKTIRTDDDGRTYETTAEDNGTYLAD